MNRRHVLQLYIALIGLLSMGVLAAAAAAVMRMSPEALLAWAPQAAVFLVLALISRRQVLISESSAHVMSTAAQIAALVALPLPLALLVIAISKSGRELTMLVRKLTRSWRAPIVNLGATLLANAVAGAGFLLIPGHADLWSADWHALFAIPSLVALSCLYLLGEMAIVAVAIFLTSADGPLVVLRNLTRGAFLPETSLILVGIMFAVVWHYSAILSFFIVVPMIFSVRSFESVARLRKETVEAVLKMAESIDYRDTGTYEHSQRLADFSRQLADTIGLTPEHIADIVLASRVHDLGKIGISNDILLKPGPLTPDERRTMEQHPVIGASILSSYSQFRGSVDIVRHHHERWDGRGYPDRLKGEHIPLGSRIIAVVDAFDSMTADRPYRKGMSVDQAVERLKDAMGTQFDPRICATFIQILIEDGTYVPPESDLIPTLRIVPQEASAG